MFRRASIRPHFDIPLGDAGQRIFPEVKAALQAPKAPFIGDALSSHAYLRIPRDQRSLLSPNLNLDVLDEGGRMTLRGRFTPHPSVWMGFMAVFFALMPN